MTAPRAALGTAAALAGAAALASAAAAQPPGPGGAPAAPGVLPAPVAAPATAAAAPTPTPTPAEAPVLLWAALGTAATALLLGGAALAVAVRNRPAPPADLTFTPAPDRRLAERVDRLETTLRALEAAAARRPAADATAAPLRREAFPPAAGARAAPGDAADRAPAADPRATGEEALGPWLAAVAGAFARVARDPSSAAPAFIARHRPQGAAAGPDGIVLLQGFEGAKLWAVRAPGPPAEGGETWALTPGEEAAVNWSAHFATQRAEVAAEVFGPAFDLEEGGGEALRMEAPAVLRRDSATGRLLVRRRGRLAGFRS